MCITTSPAELSKTILLAHSFVRDGVTLNVIGYQNKASSNGPCAMLLPIPSKAPMSPANCIDMSACPTLFKDYEEIITPRSRGGFSFGLEVNGDVQIFNSGSYTVILVARASLIPSMLDRLPNDKRPVSNPALYAQMDHWYPEGWFALCCWSGAIEAEPMVWWYEPISAYENSHFLPGLDAHDGGLPDLGAKVQVDHALVIGVPPSRAYRNAEGLLHQVPEEIRPFFPDNVSGSTSRGTMMNGDWSIPKAFTVGSLDVRFPPPGA